MDRTSVDQIPLQKYTQNIPSYDEITISFITVSGDGTGVFHFGELGGVDDDVVVELECSWSEVFA